ncbi:hypothetical protein OG884_05410 [Streptosporangium sp. NBC_01755]|uniref:hypothetical protein n=1 Tax=unclassified Streptosporangium TaxID=2632669 RepID=UPI002DD8E6D7|nr:MULTISPECIES: hypothetical protein [unclassified Streptosporangium]WSA27075.1 hypothetical protein OIE13_04075 [Streptosporangium sp. NBC_01810]WSD01367.1 hypothetical protein OG884_05410 [Streptosporangium sp. NBC_01755]
MEIVVVFLFIAFVLFGVDRLLLFLESRGHVNWRRTRRRDLSAEPTAKLDNLLEDPARDPGRRR